MSRNDQLAAGGGSGWTLAEGGRSVVRLPSNRLREVSARVQQLCEKYDLPYNSASLPRQLFRTQRIIHGLAVPEGRRCGADASRGGGGEASKSLPAS